MLAYTVPKENHSVRETVRHMVSEKLTKLSPGLITTLTRGCGHLRRRIANDKNTAGSTTT